MQEEVKPRSRVNNNYQTHHPTPQQPSKLQRWLTGTFTCTKCGKEYQTMSFGYGEAICPDCYHGEPQFLNYDDNYWLNRIITKLVNHKKPTPETQMGLLECLEER
jgi:hypothetical protein